MISANKKPFIDRLKNEWIKYGRIVIAVDYDDTIKPWSDIVTELDCEQIISVLSNCRKLGAYIVINTACNPERFDEIRAYCTSKGLTIDSINSNPIDLPYGQHGKVYANIYIDDRADLYGSLEILELAMYGVKGNNSNLHLDDIA